MSEYIYEHKPSGADHMGKPVELPMLVQHEEIVRCRDCKHFRRSNLCSLCIRKNKWNELLCSDVEPDDFCSWAERKDSND